MRLSGVFARCSSTVVRVVFILNVKDSLDWCFKDMSSSKPIVNQAYHADGTVKNIALILANSKIGT